MKTAHNGPRRVNRFSVLSIEIDSYDRDIYLNDEGKLFTNELDKSWIELVTFTVGGHYKQQVVSKELIEWKRAGLGKDSDFYDKVTKDEQV